MKPSEFIHPEEAAALRQMESISGFAALVKKSWSYLLDDENNGEGLE